MDNQENRKELTEFDGNKSMDSIGKHKLMY